MPKTFDLETILTLVANRKLIKDFDSVYDILEWMTNDKPYTHQLVRFSEECEPWLLRWFPELKDAVSLLYSGEFDLELKSVSSSKKKWGIIDKWIERIKRECGCKSEYPITRIPKDYHKKINPYDELVIELGTDEDIIIIDPRNMEEL